MLWPLLAEYMLSVQPAHGSRLTSLELQDFCNPKKPHKEYPEMRFLKAACVCNLSKLYDIMHSSGLVIPEAPHRQMVEASDKFLLHYNWLSKAAIRNKTKMWSVVPKFHYPYLLGYQPQVFLVLWW